MNRSTLVAALVLAGLVTYIYLFEHDEPSAGVAIFEVEEEAIRRVEIRRNVAEGGEADAVERLITLEKEATPADDEEETSVWYLLEPVAALADDRNVAELLSDLASIESERVVARTSQVDLKDYGLDEPFVEVRFATDDGEEHGLAFGAETPTGFNRYAKRMGDDDVLVVSSYLSDNFDKSAWELRDKAVFRLEDPQTRTISVDTPETAYVLDRSDGVWRLAKPFRAIVETYRASSLSSRFREAEWEELVAESADDLSPYGLDAPRYRLSLEPEAGSSATLLVGEAVEKSDYYAKTAERPQVFLLASDLVEELKTEPAELVSKKLFHFSTFQATGLLLEASGHQARVLERVLEPDDADRNWRQSSPEEAEVERKTVEDLLYKLNGTSAEEIVEVDTASSDIYGLANPAFTITVHSVSNEEQHEERLLIGKPDGDSVYCQRSGDDIALRLTAQTWSEIEELLTLESASKP